MKSHHLPSVVFSLLSVCVAIIGATTDVRSRLIPNRLTGPAIFAGLLLHFISGGWGEFGHSILSLLVCGGVFLVFHLAGGMGAGDVKLIASEACLLGLSNVAPLLIYTALCGGALGLALAVLRGKVRETLTNVVALTSHHSAFGLTPHPKLNVANENALRLPYALAIAGGVLLTLLVPLLSRVAS